MKRWIILILMGWSFGWLSAQTRLSTEKLLSELVKIESVSGSEGEVGRYISGYCESIGLNVERFSELEHSYNFAASLYPLDMGKPNIVFAGHIDVVPADNVNDWTYPPFSGTIADGKVWGRGTLDDKCASAMYISVLEKWVERAKTEDLEFNVTYLALSGEETGGVYGAKYVCDNYIDVLNAVVVFGEGGNGIVGVLPSKPELPVFAVAVAEKTPVWVELELAIDTFGHSSSGGGNALTVMIKDLNYLLEKKNPIVMSKLTKEIFRELGKAEGGITGYALAHFRTFMCIKKVKATFGNGGVFYPFFHNTMSINSLVSESAASNVAPHSARAIIDFRLLPGVSPEKWLNDLRDELDTNITIKLLSNPIPAEPTQCGMFYGEFKKAIIGVYGNCVVTPYLAAVSSDNNYFRQHGIPTYGILPFVINEAQLSSIHNVNENIEIAELNKGVDVINLFLSNIITFK